MTWPSLFPKPLEPVRQFRATFAAVGEFADKQRKRLRRAIWSPPASTGSNRVMDQLGSDIFGILVVAAVHQARPSFFAFGFESSEQHFTGNGVESQDYMGRVELSLLVLDRKSTRLNSSHRCISYAVFCLKK